MELSPHISLSLYFRFLAFIFFLSCSSNDRDTQDLEEPSQGGLRGRQLYMTNGCPVCHGDEGRGDGRIAGTLHPPPLDFRDLSKYKLGSSVEEISKTVGRGIAGTSMPGFSHLTPKDLTDIAKYIVALQKMP